MKYNMHDAQSRLSELLVKAQEGEEVILAKGGNPVAVIKKYDIPVKKRIPGALMGKIFIHNDFDDFDVELEGIFEIG
jgi:prevent-host-death family protein